MPFGAGAPLQDPASETSTHSGHLPCWAEVNMPFSRVASPPPLRPYGQAKPRHRLVSSALRAARLARLSARRCSSLSMP